jgi:hypothetical protein
MRRMKRLATPLAIIGAVLLVAAALLHLLAGAPVERELRGSMLSPHMIELLEIVWLGLALQWFVLAAIAIVATRMRSLLGNAILLLCALAPAITAGIIVYAVGPFAGSVLLLLAAGALTAAAVVR